MAWMTPVTQVLTWIYTGYFQFLVQLFSILPVTASEIKWKNSQKQHYQDFWHTFGKQDVLSVAGCVSMLYLSHYCEAPPNN